MQLISAHDSLAVAEGLGLEVRAAYESGDLARVAELYRLLLEHPCAFHLVRSRWWDCRTLGDCWMKLAVVLAEADETSQAVDAADIALRLGTYWRDVPDWVARLYRRDGRIDEAEEVYQRWAETSWAAQLVIAGSYAEWREWAPALRWLTKFVKARMTTSLWKDGALHEDSDLYDDLLWAHTARCGILAYIGRQPDALALQVELKKSSWPPKRSYFEDDYENCFPLLDERDAPCDGCGYDPETDCFPGYHAPIEDMVPPIPGHGAVPWFPLPGSDEISVLGLSPESSIAQQHSLASVERTLKRLHIALPSQCLSTARLEVGAYLEWCEETGHPRWLTASSMLRAAELEDAGEVASWPPPPENPCWCGSGHRYEECCLE